VLGLKCIGLFQEAVSSH